MSTDGEWRWYHTQDQDRWNQALATTRDEVILEGRAEYGGDGFLICEARLEPLDLRVDGEDVIERLEEQNDEVLDPDGDGRIIESEMAREQIDDLTEVLSRAFADWLARHKLLLASPWHFAAQRGEEKIAASEGGPA
jgi:hypothetical protein